MKTDRQTDRQIWSQTYIFQNEYAYLCRTSEGHFINVHVAGDGCSCCGTKPWNNVYDSRREPCLTSQHREHGYNFIYQGTAKDPTLDPITAWDQISAKFGYSNSFPHFPSSGSGWVVVTLHIFLYHYDMTCYLGSQVLFMVMFLLYHIGNIHNLP